MTETQPAKRQFVSFRFLRVRPEWWRLDQPSRARAKEELARLLEAARSKMILLSYSTAGIRPECDLMFWGVSFRLEDFEELGRDIHRTGFGQYLSPVYSYLSMTRRSLYIDKISPEHGESRTRILPGKHKYLFVYPFVKTREWYRLGLPERQAMMDEHIRTGNKYPSVKLNTTYSYGLDDQEFVVAFETDEPADFLDLVMELRESQASRFTLRDTPTFTCVLKTFSELLSGY
ncbi:MAG: chlorite dismutase [Elusimicrobia bacterium RIFCSPLOWO2_01_FULL_64_13]|nr:MAG: chlorite dismutase [Elusimicrobia bacterium RIFCSPHIGHO2_01_FULL_64_10]OGR97880.1 MAG: chlorite dismutase [Elusimicrobia bacterium RIFCSPLOWO2_01_FULL_64_13]